MALAGRFCGDAWRGGPAAFLANQGKASERIATAWTILALARCDAPPWVACILRSLCLRRRLTATGVRGIDHLELGRIIGGGWHGQRAHLGHGLWPHPARPAFGHRPQHPPGITPPCCCAVPHAAAPLLCCGREGAGACCGCAAGGRGGGRMAAPVACRRRTVAAPGACGGPDVLRACALHLPAGSARCLWRVRLRHTWHEARPAAGGPPLAALRRGTPRPR